MTAMTATPSKQKPTKAQRFAATRALRGILRSKTGDASSAEAWARIRAEDRAMEERHEAGLLGLGDKRGGRVRRGR